MRVLIIKYENSRARRKKNENPWMLELRNIFQSITLKLRKIWLSWNVKGLVIDRKIQGARKKIKWNRQNYWIV